MGVIPDKIVLEAMFLGPSCIGVDVAKCWVGKNKFL
jgi:hypothetical protein